MYDAASLKVICMTLTDKSAGVHPWQWDDRFDAALVSFPAAQASRVETLLKPLFSNQWDVRTIRQAPETARRVATDLGLRPEQRLYFTDPGQPAALFGAWWPWGNGQTVSLRVGITAADHLNDGELAALAADFKSWFGV
ncbi:MAG: hypothetical protein C4523_05005 [Myxococcales bacterium]|nr:MAG: hypothetical protein C4523_05005 [Myxococcales bacterium]